MTTTSRIRRPAVSGMFYPDDPASLRMLVDRNLAQAGPAAGDAGLPKALIVPHAGYVYSGPVAGMGYARIAPGRGVVERVVLLGPAHRVPVRGLAVPSVDAFETPLGLVRVDREARNRVLTHSAVLVDDAAHAPEHSLEVHLPFIQRTLGDVAVLPIVVGRADPDVIADVLDLVWGGPETLIVVSSDLSHYNEYEVARDLDRITAAHIVAGEVDSVDTTAACGAYPVRGLLEAAHTHGLEIELVDLRNSGDTAGPRDRVVGYGAFVLVPGPRAGSGDVAGATGARDTTGTSFVDGPDGDDVRRLLLDTAVRVIDGHLEGERVIDVVSAGLPEAVTRSGASFVTLERDARLLGCTGSISPVRPLIEDVAVHAVTSAFADPRLPPVTREDWHEMEVSISVLGAPEPLDVDSFEELEEELREGVDGLLVQGGGRRATFLPSVWSKVAGPGEFLDLLWRKAGLPPRIWPPDMSVDRYETVEFSDPGPR